MPKGGPNWSDAGPGGERPNDMEAGEPREQNETGYIQCPAPKSVQSRFWSVVSCVAEADQTLFDESEGHERQEKDIQEGDMPSAYESLVIRGRAKDGQGLETRVEESKALLNTTDYHSSLKGSL